MAELVVAADAIAVAELVLTTGAVDVVTNVAVAMVTNGDAEDVDCCWPVGDDCGANGGLSEPGHGLSLGPWR